MLALLQTEGSIALDNHFDAKNILLGFKEIENFEILDEHLIVVTILKKKFLFRIPRPEERSLLVWVFLFNDSEIDIPHVIPPEIPSLPGWPEGSYRIVCLYDGNTVNSLFSQEEKLIDAINRLIALLTLTRPEKEREFQKEFLVYWNWSSASSSSYDVYLENDSEFVSMDMFQDGKSTRFVESGMGLSDLNSRDMKGNRIWFRHVDEDVYYIPIIDSRGILPPHDGYAWTPATVKNIVYANQIEHISPQSLEKMKAIIPRTQNIIIVFGLLQQQGIVFAVRLSCFAGEGHTLFENILYNCSSVQQLCTRRVDYRFLNQIIGNDRKLQEKKILLVGAGSLGSYVGFELVRNGVKCIRIYDSDKLEIENIMRWPYSGLGCNAYKAYVLKAMLNLIHPEVNVDAVDQDINAETLQDEGHNVDLIIFTIGNSDSQLEFNRVLKSMNSDVPVIFAWLEAGGRFSHLLAVNYKMPGCFECLFTGQDGNLVNNRSTIESIDAEEENIIRNGCGGTRAAYGTATILRTTAALLELIKKIIGNGINRNVLIDITPDSVQVSKTKFPEEKCTCCGNC